MKLYDIYMYVFFSQTVVYFILNVFQNGKICISGGRDGFLKLWNLDLTHLSNQPFNTENVDPPSCLIHASLHSNVSC